MQILETSVIGLRSARHRLESKTYKTSVTLFPMVHVGEEAFYKRVYDDAAGHDAVLLEGVRNSAAARRITRVYRWANVERLGLVVQPRPDFSGAACRPVLADISGAEFDAEWARLPAALRTILPVAALATGLWLRLASSRERIARHMETTDLPDRHSIFAPHMFTRSVVTVRDQRLCQHLQEEIERGTGSVAVIYGAGHMSGLLQFLYRYGDYRPVESDWMTVFGL
ncbi:MAG: hypothetical protein WBB85_02845 [Albidovulum sp.]|uniref:hypothetical protein n=1 Tax=Albidovulum sp. TaxID=1872424 RepID=UPI003C89E4F4